MDEVSDGQNCSWPRGRSKFGITSVQLRARFQERESVSDAQKSIWDFYLLC